MKPLLAVLAMAGVASCAYDTTKATNCQPVDATLQQKFGLLNITEDGPVDVAALTKGKVTLVVNVATYWGYTFQYPDLNALQHKYAARGFTILALPCNQFNNQEPASKAEILRGVEWVRPGNGFKPSFPITQKISVNGADQHAIYQFLKSGCPKPPQDSFASKAGLIYEPLNNSDVRWNFEKFLVGRDGKPIRRYHSSITPPQLFEDIEAALKAKR